MPLFAFMGLEWMCPLFVFMLVAPAIIKALGEVAKAKTEAELRKSQMQNSTPTIIDPEALARMRRK